MRLPLQRPSYPFRCRPKNESHPVKPRILTIVGARPQFIKAAMLSRELGRLGKIEEIIVHTGQHFDDNMSDVFFRELKLPSPNHHLGISGGHHGAMTGEMLAGIEGVMLDERPDAALVYGDTNSTLAGALAAAKLNIPVVHVEAGLRSFNRRMPEEVNRVLTDHVSDLLLCPTPTAVANLAREGISAGVSFVGDVMHDLVREFREADTGSEELLRRLGLSQDGYAVATVHRAENTDDEHRFNEIADFLIEIARDQTLVMPVHPRIGNRTLRLSQADADIHLIEPLGYPDMQRLLAGAKLVLTDSGGLQKEACFHGKPCITLREETEWVETVEAGWNRLWQTPDFKPRRPLTEFGDGRAAAACAQQISDWLIKDRRSH